MIGGGFISEGGYGCAYHPEITKAGKDSNNLIFLTKITANDTNAENEINIGKKIFKKIKKDDINRHFAPVISSSAINIHELKIAEKHKCTHIKKSDTNDFLLMKIKYVPGLSLDKYFIQESNSSSVLRTYIYSFKHLLNGLKLLEYSGIVHNDIKNANMIYNSEEEYPILIDFGLSMPIREINNDNLRDYFYIYAPDYYYWALEIHILNYSLHINENFTEEELNTIIDTYIQEFIILKAFSVEFKNKFKVLCRETSKKYLNISQRKLIKIVLQQWNTWDCYSLCCEFIKLLYILTSLDKGEIVDNSFTAFVLKLLLNGIHPDYKRRSSTDDLMKQFSIFIMDQKLESLEEITHTISKNKKTIDKRLKDDSKKSAKLERKLSKSRKK
jgi:serine/threonine protein kinase